MLQILKLQFNQVDSKKAEIFKFLQNWEIPSKRSLINDLFINDKLSLAIECYHRVLVELIFYGLRFRENT